MKDERSKKTAKASKVSGSQGDSQAADDGAEDASGAVVESAQSWEGAWLSGQGDHEQTQWLGGHSTPWQRWTTIGMGVVLLGVVVAFWIVSAGATGGGP